MVHNLQVELLMVQLNCEILLIKLKFLLFNKSFKHGVLHLINQEQFWLVLVKAN